MRRVRRWPWSSAPPRIFTATPTLLYQLATTYGLPVAMYEDRLSVFVRNDEDEAATTYPLLASVSCIAGGLRLDSRLSERIIG